MFIFSLTKDPIIFEPPMDYDAREFRLARYHGLIGFDRRYANLSDEDTGISLDVRMMAGCRNCSPFLDVYINKIMREIIITNSSSSSVAVYYSVSENGFYCASSVRFLKKAGVALKEDTGAVPEFFTFKYVMPPRTLFKDVFQMARGQTVKFRVREEGLINISDEISFADYNKTIRNEKYAVGIANQNLHRSLSYLKTVSSKVALLFSGGLDSSILYQTSKEVIGDVEAFSTSYPFIDGQNDIEALYASSAAKALGARHRHHVVSKEDYMTGLVDAIDSAEVPVQNLQSVLLHLLFKHGIARDKRVLLNGDGADTLFGTEDQRRLFFQDTLRYRFLRLSVNKYLIRRMSRIFGKEYLSDILDNRLDAGLPYQNEKHPVWYDIAGDLLWVRSLFPRIDIFENKARMLKRFKAIEAPDLLMTYGYMSDANATQCIWSKLAGGQDKIVHYPFSTQDMLNFTFSVKNSLRLKESKYILRRLAYNLKIPEFIIRRRKSAFGLNPRFWALKGGPFDAFVPLCADFFEPEKIDELRSPVTNKAMTFWNVINYCIWKRIFIYNESPEAVKEKVMDNVERLVYK